MSMSIDAAAEVMREAMREKVKRHSLWYMFQGALMVVAGILAIAHPAMSSVALVIFFGWLLIISGIAQGISLIDARSVPHFWLQLVSVALFIIVGALFLRNPAESRDHAHAACDRVPDGRGNFKDHLFAHHTAVPELGLDPGERDHQRLVVVLSLVQHAGDCGLVSRHVAWHFAHQRRRRAGLFGLAGAAILRMRGSPGSRRAGAFR